ncbi:hypothetical protein WME95_48095 [Sorangium sp. So ce327]|uniref:hypothetical protein n=1 Tax=Sorangium sp. So ce327 TaxID=3133301 RepID=UPI003F609E11
MLDVETLTKVMNGFDRRDVVDAKDYLLAAEVLRRIADAVVARAKADGTDDVTHSPGSTPDPANANRELPAAVLKLRNGIGARVWTMCAGRVASESSKRDPENEWCIGYGRDGVAYVPKLVTDDMVRALAEQLAIFASKAPS